VVETVVDETVVGGGELEVGLAAGSRCPPVEQPTKAHDVTTSSVPTSRDTAERA
jgi:hypothetical protein